MEILSSPILEGKWLNKLTHLNPLEGDRKRKKGKDSFIEEGWRKRKKAD